MKLTRKTFFATLVALFGPRALKADVMTGAVAPTTRLKIADDEIPKVCGQYRGFDLMFTGWKTSFSSIEAHCQWIGALSETLHLSVPEQVAFVAPCPGRCERIHRGDEINLWPTPEQSDPNNPQSVYHGLNSFKYKPHELAERFAQAKLLTLQRLCRAIDEYLDNHGPHQ